jgi:threonine aldolase
MAKKLSDGLVSSNQVKLEYPTEANEVFVKLPKKMVEHLNSEEYMMSKDELTGKTVRLVTAWNTKDSEVDEFLNTIFN